MPHNTARYQKFLSTYDFHANSIDFRICSSSALEKWKNIQSFQLNQLVNGKFFFPQDRRELLLLTYDLWSRWLYEVENLCIEISTDSKFKKVDERDVALVKTLAEKTIAAYRDVITLNKSRFNQEFAEIWLRQHVRVERYILHAISNTTGYTVAQLFVGIVDELCEVMQYTLAEIHELNMLFNSFKVESYTKNVKHTGPGQMPFLIVTNLSKKVYDSTGDCLVAERLKIYQEYFEINTVYIKNYMDSPVNEYIIQCIEEVGVTVDFRRSVSENAE